MDRPIISIKARTYSALARTHSIEFGRHLARHPANAGLFRSLYLIQALFIIQLLRDFKLAVFIQKRDGFAHCVATRRIFHQRL
jgi:hypothetical protein